MKKVVNLISDKINFVAAIIACVLLFVVLACCAMQVFTRYVLNNSLYWSEEVARYLFVWCSMLGFSVAVKNGSNASIDVISGRLKGKAKLIHTLIANLIIILICMLLLVYGIRILPTMARTLSAALLIPNNYLYASVPVSACIIIIHCLSHICDAVSLMRSGQKGGEEA